MFYEGFVVYVGIPPRDGFIFVEKVQPDPNLDCRIWGMGRSPMAPKVPNT